MEKKSDFRGKHLFLCYPLLKEANIHINLICFDRNFDHPHFNVVTFVPRKQPQKPQCFKQKQSLLLTMFHMYLPKPHFLVKIAFLFETFLFNCRTFKKLTKNILLDCFGEGLSPYFRKKAKLSKWPKKPGK